MRSPIHEGLYPGPHSIEARTGASLFACVVGALAGAQLYRQTHNLLIIHFIFIFVLIWLVCMSVFVQFTHMATHNTSS